MILSGETYPFVKALDFNSKEQLIQKLNKMRKSAAELPEPDRSIVEEMTEASVEEIIGVGEDDLMEFKDFLRKRGMK